MSGPEVRVPLERLDATAASLHDVAAALEELAGTGPACGDLGDAAAVVATALAAVTDGLTRVAAEAQVLGESVRLAGGDLAQADATAHDLFAVEP